MRSHAAVRARSGGRWHDVRRAHTRLAAYLSTRPWDDLASFLGGMAGRDVSFAYMAAVAESVLESGVSQSLAATTSMHDLVVTSTPSQSRLWTSRSLERPVLCIPRRRATCSLNSSRLQGTTIGSSVLPPRPYLCSGGSRSRSSAFIRLTESHSHATSRAIPSCR